MTFRRRHGYVSVTRAGQGTLRRIWRAVAERSVDTALDHLRASSLLERRRVPIPKRDSRRTPK